MEDGISSLMVLAYLSVCDGDFSSFFFLSFFDFSFLLLFPLPFFSLFQTTVCYKLHEML